MRRLRFFYGSLERGFSIIEVLVVTAVFGILATFIFRTFIQHKSVMESEGTETSLQQQARILMQRIGGILQRAGDDPCHNYFWNDDPQQASQNNYAYAAAHPWGEGMVFSGIAGLVVNPYQAMVVNYNVLDTTPGNPPAGAPGCLTKPPSQLIDISGSPTLTHYQPNVSQLLYVDNLKDASGTSVFIDCPGVPDGSLTVVPVSFPNPMPNGPMTINCNAARILGPNVDCIYFDYLAPPDSGGNCSPNISDSDGTSQGPLCVLTDGTISSQSQLRAVTKVRVKLWLRAPNPEPGYAHPPETTACNTDTQLVTGIPFTNSVANRTLRTQQIFNLPLTEYR